MDPINRAIWRKFHVKYNEILPFLGWEGTRDDLADLFRELGYTQGAEIGVHRGQYSEVLCQRNPNLHLKCIDFYESYRDGGVRRTEGHQERAVSVARDTLAKYDCELIVKDSVEASRDIPDGSLDFVYIDANHSFDHVMLDLIHWVPKVRRDGIVAGHDYIRGHNCGVIKAVDAYTDAHNISMWYITPRDYPHSWFWRKY